MLGGTGRFTVTGGRSFHNRGSLVSPFRMIGADDAADSADIRTRFDKSSWMAGAEVQVNDSGPVSVNLGYHGEFGKTVESNDIRGTLKVRF